MNDQEWQLLDRFKEPSTWGTLSVPLSAIGISLPTGVLQVISLFGAGICVLLGILLKEKTS